ncbi:MAG: DUF1284 domain-containing protein [Eubacteriales bacterium]|nr:DUF1284 domain-containing protein [Eubacteriales bacterium]
MTVKGVIESTKMESIYLRPHHGLCIRFYRGIGYSDEFTTNMNKVIKLLENGAEITLINGGDTLCGHCPNYDGKSCLSGEKPKKYDNAVLSLTDLLPGDRMKWNVFRDILTEKVFEAGKFDEICGDCEWQHLCHTKL